jgi:UDP-N-acetylglucosamine:LPS N-acetylglucosamine transferase
MVKLMSAADLMVSKLGSMFNEAISTELPIIALEPPPGSERMQYRLLEEWKVGCAVRTVDEIVDRVDGLLKHPHLLEDMRQRARTHQHKDVSQRIARWLINAMGSDSENQSTAKLEEQLYALSASAQPYRN